MAVEIWNTSRLVANDPKCLALERIGIPVLQIRADKDSFLALDEEKLLQKSDDEIRLEIERHLDKLRNTFQKQIIGTLLRNPQSIDFQTALSMQNRLQECDAQIESLQNRLDYQQAQITQFEEVCAELTQENSRLKVELLEQHAVLPLIPQHDEERCDMKNVGKSHAPSIADRVLRLFRWF